MAFRMLSLNFLWFTKVPSSGYVDNNSVGEVRRCVTPTWRGATVTYLRSVVKDV